MYIPQTSYQVTIAYYRKMLLYYNVLFGTLWFIFSMSRIDIMTRCAINVILFSDLHNTDNALSQLDNVLKMQL